MESAQQVSRETGTKYWLNRCDLEEKGIALPQRYMNFDLCDTAGVIVESIDWLPAGGRLQDKRQESIGEIAIYQASMPLRELSLYSEARALLVKAGYAKIDSLCSHTSDRAENRTRLFARVAYLYPLLDDENTLTVPVMLQNEVVTEVPKESLKGDGLPRIKLCLAQDNDIANSAICLAFLRDHALSDEIRKEASDLLSELALEYRTNQIEQFRRLSDYRRRSDLEKARSNYRSYCEQLQDITSQLRDVHIAKLREADNIISLEKAIEQRAKDEEPAKALAKLESLEGIKRVDVLRDTILLTTEHIRIREHRSGRLYDVGVFEISVAQHRRGADAILFANKTRKVCGHGPDMHHPHIFDRGDACFGDELGEMIAKVHARSDYFQLAVLLLQFLQSVNVLDIAGRKIYAWPRIDEESGKLVKSDGVDPLDDREEEEEEEEEDFEDCDEPEFDDD